MNIRIVCSGSAGPNLCNAFFRDLLGSRLGAKPDAVCKRAQVKQAVDHLEDDYKFVTQRVGNLADHPDEAEPGETTAILDEVKRISDEASELRKELVELSIQTDDAKEMDEYTQMATMVNHIWEEVVNLSKSPILRSCHGASEVISENELSAYGKWVQKLCEDSNRLTAFMDRAQELDESPSPAAALMMDILLTELLQKEQYMYNKLSKLSCECGHQQQRVIHGMLVPMRGIWKNALRMRSDLRDEVTLPPELMEFASRYGDMAVAVRYLMENRPEKMNGMTVEEVIGYSMGQAGRAKNLSELHCSDDKEAVMVLDCVQKKFSELAEAAKRFAKEPVKEPDGKKELSSLLASMLSEIAEG